MLELLQNLAAAQSLLADIQITVMRSQDDPQTLAKAAKMAGTLKNIVGTIKSDISDLAVEAKLLADGDAALTEALSEEYEG